MNKEKQKLTNGKKYYRCYSCGSLTSENFVKENGKIACQHTVFRNCRYEFCNNEFYAADYNCFIKDDDCHFFKKLIHAKHWV